MYRKKAISFLLFTIATCYIISPWFFEKKLFFNEILAISGILILCYRRGRISNDAISICITLLLVWAAVHAVISLFRMNSLYFYLRNSVLVYSIFVFFTGFYCFPFLGDYIKKIRGLLKWYIVVFLFIPVSRLFYERFGIAVLFPVLFKKAGRWTLAFLIFINIIYGFNYDSATAFLIAAVYLLLLIAPGYQFFKQTCIVTFSVFVIFFIAVQPNLNIISRHYNYYDDKAIHEVMNSNRLLGIDGNSTWRLVLWKQVIVDHFPDNIFGVGFGTPLMKYFPVEDYSKLQTLPYIIGAHNSYIYIFGRLGIVFILILGIIYVTIFKEYFYFKKWYYGNNQIFIFWAFFAVSVIALFNPALESPIYAAGYWLLLGFTARIIQIRKRNAHKIVAHT